MVLRIDVRGAATVLELISASVTIFLVSHLVDWLSDWAEPATACLVAELAACWLLPDSHRLAAPLLALHPFLEQPASTALRHNPSVHLSLSTGPAGAGHGQALEPAHFDACIRPLLSVVTTFVLVCRWLSQSTSLGTAWLPEKLRVR